MAIVVLVLWLFTAGAGFYLLITSSLGRARETQPTLANQAPTPVTRAASGAAATSALSAAAPSQREAALPQEAPMRQEAPVRQQAGRATKDPWAPPSLVASRQAPVVPSARSLVEFAHPTGGIVGLAFWLGFALVHNRTLGWIGFGLAAATACVGLSWLAYNWAGSRSARRAGPGHPAPSFAGRLVALHGSAAAVTVTLAALAALVFRG
jgi:hypothetical protein